MSPADRPSLRPPPTSRRLSSAECRAWLGQRSQGRLGHLTGRGPRSTVVGYAVADDQIVFRLPEYNEICQYAPGRPITLSVSRAAASTHARTEVVVTGVGLVPEHQENLGEAVDHLEVWPPSVSTHLICLDLTQVEGNTVVDDELSAPDAAEPPADAVEPG
ncbi:MAG TPA: pyridoxamine 5'-phosphate oxidase family protein [Microlunatus sp.]